MRTDSLTTNHKLTNIMLPQPKTIDSFTAMLSNESARPVIFRAKLSARHDAAASTLERFDAQPLEADLDQALTAQTDKLTTAATLENFDRIRIESRQLNLTTAACVTHKAAGTAMLEAELAQRSKGRPAKMAALGKESAAAQESMFAPDLPQPEFDALETRRAKLVDEAEFLDRTVANAKNTATRFSNGPTAETWHDAVRAVRAVDFS